MQISQTYLVSTILLLLVGVLDKVEIASWIKLEIPFNSLPH